MSPIRQGLARPKRVVGAPEERRIAKIRKHFKWLEAVSKDVTS